MVAHNPQYELKLPTRSQPCLACLAEANRMLRDSISNLGLQADNFAKRARTDAWMLGIMAAFFGLSGIPAFVMGHWIAASTSTACALLMVAIMASHIAIYRRCIRTRDAIARELQVLQ